MSGNSESSNTMLDKYEKTMVDYRDRAGVMRIPEPEVGPYLKMTLDEMHGLPPDELGVAGFALARYAFYIQGEINRLKGRAKFCRDRIEECVGHKIGEYTVFGMKERWCAAIHEHDQAKRWQAIEQDALLKLESLSYYPTLLNKISDSVLEMQRSSRKVFNKL